MFKNQAVLKLLTLSSLMAFGLFSCTSSKKSESSAIESSTFVQLPGPESWKSDWSTSNSVVIHILAEPDNLHPTNGNSQTRAEINLYTQMALLQSDLRTGEMRAGLCTSLPQVSADQLQLNFELRDSILWDDGSRLTAEDIVFTAKASKCPFTDNPAAKPYFDNVKEVIADPTNPLKFTVVMKKAYIQNVGIWSDYPILQSAFFDSTKVFSKYSFSQLDDPTFSSSAHSDLQQWATKFNSPEYGIDTKFMTGLGPYQIQSWESGQAITLVKKKNHWTRNSTNYWEASYPEKIVFRVNRDGASQKLEFKSQVYDGSAYLGTRTLFDLKEDSTFNKNYHARFMDTYGFTYLALNMKPDGVKHLPLLTDAKVRRALAFATPVDDIIRVVNRGINKRVNSPVSQLKKAYAKDLEMIPYDVKKAGSLLDAAGWKDTDQDGVRDKIVNGKKLQLEIELAYMATQAEWKEMALMIAESMGKAGVKVNAVAYDFPNWMQKSLSHDFDMVMGASNSSSMPDDYGQLWSTAAWKGNGPNYTGFGDASTDALIDSISFTMDETKRMEMEYRLQHRIADDQPFVFMYGLVRRCVVHKRFNHAEFYAERPGLMYNNLQVAAPGSTVGTAQ
ncbi:hypothetical protein BH11BAC2_BH11BAC2_20130 [soil metagenome]